MIFRLIAKFSLAQVLIWIIPLLSAIVLADRAEPSEWVGVSLGMSIGAAAGLFVAGGWSLQGASELITSAESRESLILRSSIHRLVSLVGMIPILGLISIAVAEKEFWICFVSAVASAAIGAGPRWHLSATGQVSTLVRIDIIPRVVAGLAATGIVFFRGSVLLYALTLLLGQLVPIIFAIEDNRRWVEEVKSWKLSTYWLQMKGTGYSTAAEVVGAVTFASPMLIGAGTLDSQQIPALATASRIYALSLTVVTIVSNAAQSASVMEGSLKRVRVVRQNFWISIGLAFSGCVGLAILGQQISNLLFPKFMVQDNLIFVLLGFAFLAMTIATHYLRHVLLPRRSYFQVLVSNIFGLLVATFVFMILATSDAFSVTAVCLPYVVAEVTVLCSFLILSKLGQNQAGQSNEELK